MAKKDKAEKEAEPKTQQEQPADAPPGDESNKPDVAEPEKKEATLKKPAKESEAVVKVGDSLILMAEAEAGRVRPENLERSLVVAVTKAGVVVAKGVNSKSVIKDLGFIETKNLSAFGK